MLCFPLQHDICDPPPQNQSEVALLHSAQRAKIRIEGQKIITPNNIYF